MNNTNNTVITCVSLLVVFDLLGQPLEDSFVEEVELLREDSLSNDLLIEGKYMSEQAMYDEGFSEQL